MSREAAKVHYPGLKVVMSSSPADAKGFMKTAIRDDDSVIFSSIAFYTQRRARFRMENTRFLWTRLM